MSVKFDTDDARIRWMLYRYHNRCHDGEIWLAFETPNGVALREQSDRWPDGGVLLGEVQTRIINGGFEDRIVPIVERSEGELQRRREQVEAHRAYRTELYRRYSLAERLEDLTS
jgi:hypothetical protein